MLTVAYTNKISHVISEKLNNYFIFSILNQNIVFFRIKVDKSIYTMFLKKKIAKRNGTQEECYAEEKETGTCV